jgi:hypothetical protein
MEAAEAEVAEEAMEATAVEVTEARVEAMEARVEAAEARTEEAALQTATMADLQA